MSKRIFSLLLVVVMLVACLTSCGLFGSKDPTPTTPAEYKQGTYRSFTSVLPSNWNELTYQDNNDTQILSYIGSSFFEYDYNFDESKGGKFNEDGSINTDAIVEGSFTTNFSAATKLEDVTASVDAKWGYTDAQKAAGGYAWKITLRQDLKWDDGTAINAHDFIYSMKEQLSPLFMNYRADTYYNNIRIKNAKGYLFSTTDYTYETIDSMGYASTSAAIAAGEVLYVDLYTMWGAQGAPMILSYDENYVPVLDFVNTCPQYGAYNDDTLYFDYGYFVSIFTDEESILSGYGAVGDDGSIDFAKALEAIAAYNAEVDKYNAGIDADTTLTDEEKENQKMAHTSLAEYFFSASMVWSAYVGYGYFEPDTGYTATIKVENTNKVTDFADVGLYAVSDYELVLCLEAPVMALKDDGSLSYLAAYYLASLPLVKKDLYESCKQEPVEGSTLWTTNYNSSLETSASWGPYKLSQFQGGKSYTLVKNDKWFGYALDDYKNQYNVTKIECEVVPELDTQWMGFLSGKFDGIGIDSDHLEYVNSKYAIINYGSTAYGIQIYSDLDGLKNSGRNNGILAIQDFRQALSLAMNRDDFNQTVFGTLPSSYGLIGEGYYSDIENGVVYRNTPQAKKVLLRTYGFTENADGTWYDGTHTYADVDAAYEAMNGYNPTKAKELLNKAIEELTNNAEYYGYDSTKNITFLYGATNSSETSTKKQIFMQKLVDDLTKGTVLEGKIKIEMDPSFGSTWSDAFKAGAYELCIIAGIGGNIFNPFNTIGAFVNPNDSLKFSSWWDSSKENVTFKMPDGVYEGAGKTYSMSVLNWYYCLNGLAEANNQKYKFNWGENVIPNEARLEVLAMLEEYALSKFFSLQCSFDAEMALDGAKFSNLCEDYNTFMGYGGIRYYVVNYTDAEWDAFVKSNNNDLSNVYKQEG